jgi:hypothetical protein
VLPAEVSLPDRRVVDGPVGLRDLILQRARRPPVIDGAERAVVVGRLRVAELADNRPDRVLALAG